MSYAPRPVPFDSGRGQQPPQMGSARAAWERPWLMQEQGLNRSAPELSQSPPGQPQRPLRGQASLPTFAPAPAPAPAHPTNGEPSQWPLMGDSSQTPPAVNLLSGTKRPRGPPPPRPPRPSYMQSLMEDAPGPVSPQSARAPSSGRRQLSSMASDPYQPDDGSRPVTLSSRDSANSSLGPIPDFPVPQPPTRTHTQPQMAPAPRRPTALGMPMSSRRGPSAYLAYTQATFVSPIAEESESRRDSRRSFASSNVFPNRVMSSNSYLFSEGETPSDDEEPLTNKRQILQTIEDEPPLVRNASLGKRSKPTLTTIRNGDNSKEPGAAPGSRPSPPNQSSSESMFPARPTNPMGFAVTPENTAAMSRPEGYGRRLSQGTGFLDSTSSESSSPSLNEEKRAAFDTLSPSQTPRVTRNDPRVGDILTGLRKSGTLDRDASEQATSRKEFKHMSQRNSSRLSYGFGSYNNINNANVDDKSVPTKDIDSRASMSLPDLIRRATRLAANLDRGKTASTMGTEWMNNMAQRGSRSGHRSNSSLADMLASFPPPGWATPNSGERRVSTRDPGDPLRKPSPLGGFDTMLPDEYGREGQRRNQKRVCGIRLWIFILLMVLIFLLFAASVAIPIGLIVIPRERAAARQNAAATALATCENTLRCQNGGSSIVNPDGSCGCLCSNGFTGRQCTNANLVGCTSIGLNVIPNANATIGDAIPRVVDVASSTFNISIDVTRLLVLFSALSTTCASENALVTFNGTVARRAAYPSHDGPAHDLYPRHPLPLPIASPIAKPEATTLDPAAPITSGGIIFASAASRVQSPASSIVPLVISSRTAGAAVPTASASSSSGGSLAATILDFARVSVLFVLQVSNSFDTAASAQQTLQGALGGMAGTGATGSNGVGGGLGNVTLQGGFTVDLVRYRIAGSNGTLFGLV